MPTFGVRDLTLNQCLGSANNNKKKSRTIHKIITLNMVYSLGLEVLNV